jgi:hypothetical protein
VNQQQPIYLSWSPAGFAGLYYVQIATTPDFAAPVVDIPYQTDAYYVWNGAAPNATYYWRVNTSNDGGTSDWVTNSFATVPPALQMTSPNGGEVWLRGSAHFVTWIGNLPENVSVALYKSGNLVQTLSASTADTGAIKWSPGFNLTPGSDYSIRVTSTTNSAMVATSAGTFSIIDAPTLAAGAVTRLPGGGIQLALAVPGAAQATVLCSTNLTTWQTLAVVPLVNGTGVYQDSAATNFAERFYRLSVP